MIKFELESENKESHPLIVALDVEDGDLNLIINGEAILWVCRKSGKLFRQGLFEGNQPEGLEFEKDGRIKIGDNEESFVPYNYMTYSEEIQSMIQDIRHSLIEIQPHIFSSVSHKLRMLEEKILGEKK